MRCVYAFVRLGLRLRILAALPALLAGHAATALLASRIWGLPQHSLYGPALEIALAVLLSAVAVLTLASLTGRPLAERLELPSLARLTAELGAIQLVGYLALEAAEAHPASWLGVALQIALAVLGTLSLRGLHRWLIRCENLSQAFASGWPHGARFGLRPVSLALACDRAGTLRTCVGTRRYQRPPPRTVR